MEIQVGSLSNLAYLLNLLVWLIGAALTGLGLLLYTKASDMGTAVNDELAPIMIVVIAIGGVLLFTASMGLLGVCRKQSVLLSGFLAAMIIVLLAQFAAVVILFTFEASVHYYLADGLQHSILFYGKDGDNAKFTKALDYLQQNLKCCGEYGFDDYMSPNASNWFSNNFGDLPDTCCEVVTENCGVEALNVDKPKEAPKGFYLEGCFGVTKDNIKLWLTIAGSAALVFMFVQVMAIFLNITLQKRFKEHEDYQLQSKKVKGVKDQEQAQDKAVAAAPVTAV